MQILNKSLIFFVLSGLMACSPAGEKSHSATEQSENMQGVETQEGDLTTYETERYSIQYPSDWKLDRTSSKEVEFQLFSPLSTAEDRFSENVNLLVQDLRGQPIKNLDQYVEISESQILVMLQNSEIQSGKRIRKNGREFHRVEFTATQGKYKLKQVQYYYFEDQVAYALTFTSEQEQYDTYRETGIDILESFKLKNWK